MTFPRRVLMTADTVGGVFSYAVELSRELAETGVEITLVTMGRSLTDAQREELSSIPNLRCLETTYALEWMEDPWKDVDAAAAWLLEAEATFRPDVIHLNGFAHAALPWSRPVFVVAHSCVASWFRAVRGQELPPAYAEYGRRVRAGLAGATLVVAPTAAFLAELSAVYGELPWTRVIPNGIRPDGFQPATKEPFFLAAGRLWDAAKNLELVARCAHRLPWPVLVAGELRGSPPGPAVRWLGARSRAELSALMGRAAVFLHPARYEPFGLAPLEAALSGAALVLGDIPALREIWGPAALFVPPDANDAFVNAASRLAEDAALRAELSARARARALELSAGRMARAYLDAYRELARIPAPRLRQRSETRSAASRSEDRP
ncbi:MAG TPA: glycosyltransferase family 4 protein [Polyangiaceae bacterium]|nr:glycosyltransferase family 4 protein [Polyangiaceae bacterium]